MMPPSIAQYIKAEATNFEADEIQVGDNWYWNFRKHVQLIFHLKNDQFYTGTNDYLRAFKAVMEPMLELASWTEDIEVKDVVFFIENNDSRALSFLVKKYHDEKYVREHDLDTLFDEITDSDLAYGGVLVQEGKERPEIIPLNAVAFCDQTDLLGGPVGFRHYFSPSKLKQMSKRGWGSEKNGATVTIDELITLASYEKDTDGTLNEKKNKVPGKTIETYIVRGDLPEAYLDDSDNFDDYYPQIQVVAFYKDKEGKEQSVTLYRKKADDNQLEFFTSKSVHGRALGRGIGERLIHPQIFTNLAEIRKTELQEAAAKIIPYTDDESFDTKNNLRDVENLEVKKVAEGRTFGIIPTVGGANIQVMENAINAWYAQAQLQGSAFDPILGKEATSGTTFRGQERTVAQGRGAHDKRRGQRAKFIEELYRRYIIPRIKAEIVSGPQFLASLSTEELAWVADQLATKYANARIKEAMIKEGKVLSPEEQELLKTEFKKTFAKGGNKKLVKVLKDEFADIELNIGINVAGKQKDLAMLSDKLLSIFQFIFANPAGFQQAMQNPALAKAFSDILEFSGMSIADFSTMMAPPAQALAPAAPAAPGAAPAPAMALSAPAPAE